MAYTVTGKYMTPPGSITAPGEHYTLRSTEPDRNVSPDSYRQYSFYRPPTGDEIAADIGTDYRGTDYYVPVDKDSETFRQLKEAVERYERTANVDSHAALNEYLQLLRKIKVLKRTIRNTEKAALDRREKAKNAGWEEEDLVHYETEVEKGDV